MVILFDDTLPAMVAAFLARIKVRLFTRQDSCFHWNYAPRWVFLDCLNALLATRVIAVSEDTRTFTTEKEHVAASKVGMVHHGIPPGPFTFINENVKERLRERFGLHNSFPVIGTVARFIEWERVSPHCRGGRGHRARAIRMPSFFSAGRAPNERRSKRG